MKTLFLYYKSNTQNLSSISNNLISHSGVIVQLDTVTGHQFFQTAFPRLRTLGKTLVHKTDHQRYGSRSTR